MNNKWYIEKDRSARGPFSDLQMREKIQSGEIGPKTLSYKEGAEDWKSLEDQDIWTPTFAKDKFNFVESPKEWVLLVENPIKKGDFEQQGPMTAKEVQEKLKGEELTLTDYCWKQGMKDWLRLSEVPALSLKREAELQVKKPAKKEAIHITELDSSIQFLEEELVEAKPEESQAHAKASSPRSEKVNLKSPVEFSQELQALADPVGGDFPEFVEIKQDQETQDFFSEEEAEVARVEPLPSLKETLEIEKRKKSSFYSRLRRTSWFFIFVCLLFFVGLFAGLFFMENQGLQKVKELSEKAKSFFVSSPSFSYVSISESLVEPSVVRVRSDVAPGHFIYFKVLDSAREPVKLKEGMVEAEKALKIQVNEFGVAEVNMNRYELEPFKEYELQARLNKLVAHKKYTTGKLETETQEKLETESEQKASQVKE